MIQRRKEKRYPGRGRYLRHTSSFFAVRIKHVGATATPTHPSSSPTWEQTFVQFYPGENGTETNPMGSQSNPAGRGPEGTFHFETPVFLTKSFRKSKGWKIKPFSL